MSGAEVVGLITGSITLAEAIINVYKAANDKTGLPAAFREVYDRVPLVKDVLCASEQRIKLLRDDDQAIEVARSRLEPCKTRLGKLEEIFKTVIPGEDDTKLVRYKRAARTWGKEGKVETLMKGVLDDLSLLSTQRWMEDSAHIEELKEAIQTISKFEPSLPDELFDESRYTNNNFGGTQHNYNASGGENKYHTGSGHQFNGPITTLNLGGKQ
jgi:hypothetical protein